MFLGAFEWAAIGTILHIVLQIFAPVIIILASWLLWKLAGKIGIEKSIALDDLMREKIKVGIDFADAWALSMSEKPSAKSKLITSIVKVYELLDEAGIPAIAREKLVTLIEAQLVRDKKEGEEVKYPS